MSRRGLQPPEPSPAEKQAQAWHDLQHADEEARCWCCCRACRRGSPHYLAAKRAALNDIAARISDSMLGTRLPPSFPMPLPRPRAR